MRLVDMPYVFRCMKCGREWPSDGHTQPCPKCGWAKQEVVYQK